jgi:hypothetical protein
VSALIAGVLFAIAYIAYKVWRTATEFDRDIYPVHTYERLTHDPEITHTVSTPESRNLAEKPVSLN